MNVIVQFCHFISKLRFRFYFLFLFITGGFDVMLSDLTCRRGVVLQYDHWGQQIFTF